MGEIFCLRWHHFNLYVIYSRPCCQRLPVSSSSWRELDSVSSHSSVPSTGHLGRLYSRTIQHTEWSIASSFTTSSCLEAASLFAKEARNISNLSDRIFVSHRTLVFDGERQVKQLLRACIASIVSLYYRIRFFKSPDQTWNAAPFITCL